eukprot:6199917-Pleurochrysis_carterae.AAC.1
MCAALEDETALAASTTRHRRSSERSIFALIAKYGSAFAPSTQRIQYLRRIRRLKGNEQLNATRASGCGAYDGSFGRGALSRTGRTCSARRDSMFKLKESVPCSAPVRKTCA